MASLSSQPNSPTASRQCTRALLCWAVANAIVRAGVVGDPLVAEIRAPAAGGRLMSVHMQAAGSGTSRQLDTGTGSGSLEPLIRRQTASGVDAEQQLERECSNGDEPEAIAMLARLFLSPAKRAQRAYLVAQQEGCSHRGGASMWVAS